MILLLSLPLIYLPEDVAIYCSESTPLLMLTIAATAAIIATILLYKVRLLQIRISIFNSIILLGLQGWIAYYIFFDPIPSSSFSITAVFPIAAFILTLVAIRYIGRDEAMIRSLSRLRR
jgi:hypothetical protein